MLKQLSLTPRFRALLLRGRGYLCLGLALMSVVLCAGCELTALRTPPTPETTPAVRLWQHPETFTLIPWAPIEAPPGAWERTQKIVAPLYQQYKARELSQEVYDQKVHEINVAALGLLSYTRLLAEHGHYDAPTYADRALAENPDDFETLLTWAYIGGQELYYYGDERAAVLRRLYDMQPHHPYVLHHLALCIYGKHPAEALGYAQQAQQLEPRYLPYGVDGLCYYQLGDYEQAMAAFKRAHAAAPARMKRATLQRVKDAWKTGAGEDVRQRLRDAGVPLMGPMMFIRH